MRINPPVLLDLEWTVFDDGECATALATELFWPLYREKKSALRRLGISVFPEGQDWLVKFEAQYSHPGVQGSIGNILADYERNRADSAERQRIAREAVEKTEAARRDARAAATAALMRKNAEVLAERLPVAIDDARKLLIKYREFVDRKAKLEGIIQRFDDPDVDDLSITDLNILEDAIHATRLKHTRTMARAKRASGGVNWKDEEVVEAIILLTQHDADHAAVKNHVGWNKADSSLGHWCFAMLESNREAAIALARTLVGKYATTQLGRAA